MARQLRIEYSGAFYHVIQRGIERRDIFISDKDREKFLSYLNAASHAYKAIFHAYALMNNHYHLILETPQANLCKIMHYINTSYAIYYNTKRKRAGPLYQGRFKAIIVDKDEYLHYLSCYIHLNPVRAGIVKSPQEYPHSSYNYFISHQTPPQWLHTNLILSMFDDKTTKAKRRYKQFVIDNMGKEKDIITNNIKKGFVLGGEDFFESIRDKINQMADNSEIPALKKSKSKKESSLEQIKSTVEKHVNNDKRLARSLSIYLSRKNTQKTHNEIAAFYGNIGYTGISQVLGRIEKRRGVNKYLEKLIAKIDNEIKMCEE